MLVCAHRKMCQRLPVNGLAPSPLTLSPAAVEREIVLRASAPGGAQRLAYPGSHKCWQWLSSSGLRLGEDFGAAGLILGSANLVGLVKFQNLGKAAFLRARGRGADGGRSGRRTCGDGGRGFLDRLRGRSRRWSGGGGRRFLDWLGGRSRRGSGDDGWRFGRGFRRRDSHSRRLSGLCRRNRCCRTRSGFRRFNGCRLLGCRLHGRLAIRDGLMERFAGFRLLFGGQGGTRLGHDGGHRSLH